MDEEYTTTWSGEVRCNECEHVQELDEVEATLTTRGDHGAYYYFWTCEKCGQENEGEEEYWREDDRDPPEPDYDYTD
jgi:hypothetical protein